MAGGRRSAFCLALLAAFLTAVKCDHLYGDDYSYTYGPDTDSRVIDPEQPCPPMCDCLTDYVITVTVYCVQRNLTRIPLNLSDFADKLYLDGNNFGVLDENFFPYVLKFSCPFFVLLSLRNSGITEIRANAFKTTSALKTIDLTGNQISHIDVGAFNGLPKLEILIMEDCGLHMVSNQTFGKFNLPMLWSLSLRQNRILGVTEGSFVGMPRLEQLYLDDNWIKRLRTRTFQGLKRLTELSLNGNHIYKIFSRVFDDVPALKWLGLSRNRLNDTTFLSTAFTRNSRVEWLDLKDNELTTISATTFQYFRSLEKLELSYNSISNIASFAFKRMRHLFYLSLSHNRLSEIQENMLDESVANIEELYLDNQFAEGHHSLTRIAPKAFQFLKSVKTLHLNQNDLRSFDEDLFVNMTELEDLQCQLNQLLTTFPHLKDASKLKIINMHMTDVTEIPEGLCSWAPNLTQIDVALSSLKRIPSFQKCTELQQLNFNGNMLTHQAIGEKLSGLSKLLDLELQNNELGMITDGTFRGLTSLEHLNLKNNPITFIWSGAFASFQNIEDLFLQGTKFSTLPTAGLQSLEQIFLDGNSEMTVFPDIHYFPRLRTAKLNYPYHCCMWREFIPKAKSGDSVRSSDVDFVYSTNGSDKGFLFDDAYNDDGGGSAMPPDYSTDGSGDYYTFGPPPADTREVICLPLPNALTPCDDLLEYWWLRLFVWLFMVIALAANAVVFIIIMTTRTRHAAAQTARFFVTFLALADFSLGLYLAFIAFVDVLTTGQYSQHALEWKVSTSCQAAGFFAIFGSVLSVWTLTAITLDRLLAVTFAVRHYKISKAKAWAVMAVGVAAATTVAVLPLVGISRYTNVGVCLPFDIATDAAKRYVTFLLIFPLLAVFIISCSYFRLYRVYSHSRAWNASETKVAFRVALLVFFNCACWVPIAVIGLLVIYGDRTEIVQTSGLEGNNSGKISLFVAKVLVAIFFPINAVFDPFFYAISTPHFRRDLTNLLKKFKTKIQAISIRRSQASSRSRRPSVSSGPNRPATANRAVNPMNQLGGSSDPEPPASRRNQGGPSVSTNNTFIMHSVGPRNVPRNGVSSGHRPGDLSSVESVSRNVHGNNTSASDSSNYNINVVQTTAETHNGDHQRSAASSTPPCPRRSVTERPSQLIVEQPGQGLSQENRGGFSLEAAGTSSDSDSQRLSQWSPFPPSRVKTVTFKNSVVRLSVADPDDSDMFMAQETSV